MKKILNFNIKKLIISTAITLLLSFICIKLLNSKKDVEKIHGDLLLVGSSSMQQICEEMADEIMKKYPQISITETASGSTEAIFAIANNSADIGNLSREIESKENPMNFKQHLIAKDLIAVCTNKKNILKNISTENLKKIFTGEIKNWSFFGGPNKEIVVIGRDCASGTRKSFEKILNLIDKCRYAIELENNGKIKFKIQNDEDSIGYISLSSTDEEINTLKIDGFTPTLENAANSKYPLVHPLLQITTKNGNNKLVDLWFSFLSSEKGIEILKRNRFLPVSAQEKERN